VSLVYQSKFKLNLLNKVASKPTPATVVSSQRKVGLAKVFCVTSWLMMPPIEIPPMARFSENGWLVPMFWLPKIPQDPLNFNWLILLRKLAMKGSCSIRQPAEKDGNVDQRF